ncbi:ankyrin-3-like [Phymastichus coffea]|uniref:ankyrin-3-like n=1 Tax=Phymastichus coffea TaxID=108790 RepID=UPI00273C5309|nr:ankyrin-3-like [Phymastichus coffea]XP_058795210.1 ankyrin-3-like [Phymastichus coffea]
MTMVSSILEAVGNGDLNQLRKSIAFHKIIDDDWTDYKLLIASLNQENKDVIKLLLNNGCRVQHVSKNHFKDSPLYCAIFKQDEDILKLLLKQVSLTSIDYESESIFESITKISHEKIKLILEAYIDQNINLPDHDGFTPFHLACYIGDINLVKQFLSFDCDPDCCIHVYANSFAGYSALHFAVESRCPQTVELLLQVCSNIMVKNLIDQSPFCLACEKRIEPIIDLFIKVYSQKNIKCIEDEAFALLYKELMIRDLSFCLKYARGVLWTSWTWLHFAIIRQKTQLVKFLLEFSDNNLVNVADKSGLTPLHLACQCSFKTSREVSTQVESRYYEPKKIKKSKPANIVEIVEMLLANGSNVNAKDDFDRTPLFYVLETFKCIDPNGISQITRSNLIRIRLQLFKILVDYKARIDIADKDGMTLLHHLSDRDLIFYEHDKIKLAQQLLSMGADVNAKTRRNVTPLFLSIRNKFTDLAKLYINSNADVNCACSYFNKFTPLHALPYYNEYNYESNYLLRQLLEHGADVNASETDNATALHIAIDYHGLEGNILDDRDEMATALLDYGANVDALDKHRQTPLHRACLNRYNKGTIVLLDYGADINIEDDFSHTPLDYAGYRIQQESNPSFFYTIRHHVHKLKFIGCHVSGKNEQCLQELEKFYAHRFKIPKIEEFLGLCAKEIAKMKDLKLDNYTTMYDILLKSANDMTRHIKNDEFAKIMRTKRYKIDFKIYGYLLQLQYQRGLKRSKLMEPAQTSLKALSDCELPDTSIKIIFDHLSDADLQDLIDAY